MFTNFAGLAGQGQQLLAGANSSFNKYGAAASAKGAENAEWMKGVAATSGVGDYASWAAQKSVQAGSAASNAASEVMKNKIASEFGEEVFDMLTALDECTQRMKGELGLKDSKFPMSLALPLVHLHHDSLPPPKPIKEEKSMKFLLEAQHWLRYAAGVYGVDPKLSDIDNVQKAITCDTEIIMANVSKLPVMCPGHAVCVDKNKKYVILAVRGTSTIADAITDAVGDSESCTNLSGLTCHKAMLAGAKEVLKRTQEAMEQAFAANPGFKLMVTGHSLGAGTSCLCAMLLKAGEFGRLDKKAAAIRCFAYAPPPVASPLSNLACKAVEIHSFVNRHDAVPRACLSNIFRLGQEAMAVDQSDLSLLQRLALVRKGKVLDEDHEHKSKVVTAVQQQRETDHHCKFPPLFVPGTVYWIDRPEVDEQGGHKIFRIDTNELQSFNLKGGADALKDHLCTNYQVGIDEALKDAVVDGCDCAACSIM